MVDFQIQPPVQIARRLEIRGADSSSWIAVLIPDQNSEIALNGLRADLSSLLQQETRIFSLRDATFEHLREQLHSPNDDIVILAAVIDLGSEGWSSVDLMRSALERCGPVVLWISPDAFAGLSEFAPNVRSFVGPSVFVAGPDGAIMSEQERTKRIAELVNHYGLTNEEIIRRAESRELPLDSPFVEWLVLLGRGDLV